MEVFFGFCVGSHTHIYQSRKNSNLHKMRMGPLEAMLGILLTNFTCCWLENLKFETYIEAFFSIWLGDWFALVADCCSQQPMS